jgi:hypothetical protein
MGVSAKCLARMLGHKDPSVTLRIYADLFDTDLDAVAATLHTQYHASGREVSVTGGHSAATGRPRRRKNTV